MARKKTNLYKQMSNRRDSQTGKRWQTQKPGWREREPERPKLIAKVSEVAFGSDASLDKIASQVYSWRSDLVGMLIAGQVTPWARNVTASAKLDKDNGELAPIVQLREL